MSKPIAFIIGAGKRIGASTAEVLQSKGYRVALAARSLKQEDSTDDELHLSVDLSNPDSIAPAFTSLRKQWGEPSVIFYNGKQLQYSMERPSDH
jgi:NAD(P)-dependent dehydrogenase (short-subunit alcohol dehydrogenase family)